jgi:hypothetical protein
MASHHTATERSKDCNQVSEIFSTGMDYTRGRKLMTKLINLDRLRTVMEEALSVCVQGVQLPGIEGAALRNVAVSLVP